MAIIRNGLEYRFVHVNRFTIAFTINDEQRIVAVRGLFCSGQDVWARLKENV